MYAEIDFEDDGFDNDGGANKSVVEKKQVQRRNLQQWYRQFTVNTEKHEPKKLTDGAYEHDITESHKVGTTLGRGLSTMLVTKML